MQTAGYAVHGPYTSVKTMKPKQVGYFSPYARTSTPLVIQKSATPARQAGARDVMPLVAATGAVQKQKWQDPQQEPGNMFFCNSLSEWCSQEAGQHQGLCMKRGIDPHQWQPIADQLSKQMTRETEDTLHKETIDLNASEDALRQRFQEVGHAVSQCLRQDPALANLVCQDAQAICDATYKLVPQAKQLIVKLELFGETVCGRWHQDNCVCRSIVSYNCTATVYTPDSNVDFYEMEHCGNNDCIIRDKSRILSADVGDVIFMKGLTYPASVNGLCHKSPPIEYFNGDIVTRLVLKVDVRDLYSK